MTFKRIKGIIITIGIIGFILFLIRAHYDQKTADENFMRKEYSGIIDSIHFYDGNRGFPVVRINGKWHPFGVRESGIANYIKVGDSILKETDSDSIYIFRVNSNSLWVRKGFRTKR